MILNYRIKFDGKEVTSGVCSVNDDDTLDQCEQVIANEVAEQAIWNPDEEEHAIQIEWKYADEEEFVRTIDVVDENEAKIPWEEIKNAVDNNQNHNRKL